ncbi:hypothetical protein IPJ63_02435 [Candidatus Nomurabacteria bacterium]|nr:MAG: hypothetical protein IPJ63_02435 [Candidatus Nomurabacteria bacterium]
MISKFTQTIKDFFGDNNEFVASFDLAIKERITSPFYGYFIVSWLMVNWKIIYIAFFINQEEIYNKYNVLRNEYLSTIFPSIYSWDHWFNFLILPILLTFFFFWVSPKITRIFYRKSIKNQIALKVIEIQETRKEAKEKTELIKDETEVIKQELQKIKEEKKIASEAPEMLWEKEYAKFFNSTYFSKFESIIDSIYLHSGNIKEFDSYNNMTTFMIPKDILVYSHTNELIKIDKTKDKIELTEKGKFFIKKYSSN